MESVKRGEGYCKVREGTLAWRVMHTRLVVTLIAVACTLVGCRKERTPEKWVFAEGFEGEAAVLYGVPSAPALPRDGGMWRIEVPADGIVRTSTRMEEGWAKDEYFRRQGDKLVPLAELAPGGKGSGVFGGATGTVYGCEPIHTLFVGDSAKQVEMDAALKKKLEPICKK